jgi:hypothetical protein
LNRSAREGNSTVGGWTARELGIDVGNLVRAITPATVACDAKLDRQRLASCNLHVLALDWDGLNAEFDDLLAALEARLDEFRAMRGEIRRDTATRARLDGWAVVVNDAAGVAHLANRHFLYRSGVVLDDSVRRRLESLIRSGIVFLDATFERSVETPEDWLAIASQPDAVIRRRLANACSYVARDAYSIDSGSPLEELLPLLRSGHIDIVTMLPTFAMVPFASADDELLTVIGSAIDAVGTYLEGLAGAAHSHDEHVVGILRSCHERASHSLGLAPRSVSQRVNSATSRISMLRRAVRRARSLSRGEAGVQLRAATSLTGRGAIAAAHAALPSPRTIRRMSLTAMFSYLNVAPLLLSREEFDVALEGVFERLVRLSADSLGTAAFLARSMQYVSLIEDRDLIENANAAFDLAAPSASPDQHDGPWILLAIDQCRVTPGLLAPMSGVLVEHGARFFNLQQNRLDNDLVQPWPFGPRLTANSAAVIGNNTPPDQFLNDWIVDLPNGRVEADGVNFFQGVYERVGRVLKVYDVDWDSPGTRTYVDLWLRQLDRTVFVLRHVRQYAETHRQQMRFVTVQSHFVPWSAFRQYCATYSDFLEHVTISSSYESWKTNAAGKPLSTLALLNNTRNPKPSLPAFGSERSFRTWRSSNFDARRGEYERLVGGLLTMNRAGDRTSETTRVLDEIAAERRRGRRVLCLLGKIPYDLAVPTQGGPAHCSMGDWLNHSIRCANAHDDVVLYIKPHPHEVNDSIGSRPTQSFIGVIREPIGDRIRILPHRGVNVQDLLSVVDIFLVWNGSSIAELGAQGATIVAADSWAAANYPIGVYLPQDREHYERLLSGDEFPTMAPDFQERSAAYVAYLTEAPFAIPYPMVDRSSTNVLFNRAEVRLDAITGHSLDELRARSEELLDHFGFDR